MAILSFQEKQLIEKVFGMGSGYVLNFSNREFEEFMKDVVSYNIYQKYPGLPKAKMLRRFIEDESDVYVGKMIILLINYMKNNSLCGNISQEDISRLYEFGRIKLGKESHKRTQTSQKDRYRIDFESLKKSLLDIEKKQTQQQKGYAFENYLKELFDVFGLDARPSYRTTNDQIDGSFLLNGNTILIEAKYRTTEISKDDLLLFSNKVKAKSPFTKGVFITLSNPSNKTLEYFYDKSSRIILFTVEELYLLCENKVSLIDILNGKFRYFGRNRIYISPYHESVIKYTSNYTGYPITNSCLIKI